jgi:alpha-D-ribose 1-methylphosphonate 5-triphosphate synthase subunit PhnG
MSDDAKISNPEQVDRANWMGLLARANPKALAQRMSDLGPLPSHAWLRRPEIGAIMTRGRAGGTGEAFSMGEMTVTRCALRLIAAPEIIGHAYVQGRDSAKAEMAAIADAILQSDGPQAARVRATVLAPLANAEENRRLQARRKAGATKVDFFTMVRAEG